MVTSMHFKPLTVVKARQKGQAAKTASFSRRGDNGKVKADFPDEPRSPFCEVLPFFPHSSM